MNKDIIFQILCTITEKSKEDLMSFPENHSLLDLGLDSLKFIRFIVAVEEQFNIEIYDSDLLFTNFDTIEKLFSTLEKYFKDAPLKKVLICDCDNVLWHGVAGEEKIYIDSLAVQLQRSLLDLYNNGVLLCLCSKNEKANIDFAFESLNMVLKKEHIALSKINFRDKATNIKEIALELHLSLDSFVFLDDSDYELGLVSALIPQVYTVKADYSDWSFISEINDLFAQSASSLNRTRLYREQKEREKEKLQFATVQEYNLSLETKTTFHYDNAEEAPRIAELTQRTNQFNLSGKRYTEEDILSFMKNQSYTILTLSVSDKYGDMGIIGAAIYESKAECVVIHAFYLSCRAFGRDFATLMLDEIKKLNKPIYGVFHETDKNKKQRSFYDDNGVSLYE